MKANRLPLGTVVEIEGLKSKFAIIKYTDMGTAKYVGIHFPFGMENIKDGDELLFFNEEDIKKVYNNSEDYSYDKFAKINEKPKGVTELLPVGSIVTFKMNDDDEEKGIISAITYCDEDDLWYVDYSLVNYTEENYNLSNHRETMKFYGIKHDEITSVVRQGYSDEQTRKMIENYDNELKENMEEYAKLYPSEEPRQKVKQIENKPGFFKRLFGLTNDDNSKGYHR